jgi:hypothetical protein
VDGAAGGGRESGASSPGVRPRFGSSGLPPLDNNTAGPEGDWAGPPVSAHVRVSGLYNSGLEPPVTRTRPLGSNVAAWPARTLLILPVGAYLPVTGSYNSALDRVVQLPLGPPKPPVTRTWPVASSVAVVFSVASVPDQLSQPRRRAVASSLLASHGLVLAHAHSSVPEFSTGRRGPCASTQRRTYAHGRWCSAWSGRMTPPALNQVDMDRS